MDKGLYTGVKVENKVHIISLNDIQPQSICAFPKPNAEGCNRKGVRRKKTLPDSPVRISLP